MTRRTPRDDASRLKRLRAEWGDPLLTVLTILLAAMMFVVAPLHAAGVVHAEMFGFVLAFVVAAAVLVLSGNPIAVVAIVLAIGIAFVAAVLRLHEPSTFDIYLSAVAWLLLGLALIWVVARAVFAPGRVTYHRVIGAILLYLAIGLTFVALFTLVGLRVPDGFGGLAIKDSPGLASTMTYFSFGVLSGAGTGDIVPLHPIVRSLSLVEAMIGQLYPATLLARLVTLEIEGAR
jgi:hypothetical protein